MELARGLSAHSLLVLGFRSTIDTFVCQLEKKIWRGKSKNINICVFLNAVSDFTSGDEMEADLDEVGNQNENSFTTKNFIKEIAVTL